MPGHQRGFFATRSDLEELLGAIEAKRKLRFHRTGLFDSSDVESTLSLRESPGLGVSVAGDENLEPTYLAMNPLVPIVVRPVEQRRGGTKYAVDQLANPRSVMVRPGGVFGDKVVISGKVGTVSEHPDSVELYRLFDKEIKQQFVRIKSYHVGKGAAALLDQGWRLTASVRSPPPYDLQRA